MQLTKQAMLEAITKGNEEMMKSLARVNTETIQGIYNNWCDEDSKTIEDLQEDDTPVTYDNIKKEKEIIVVDAESMRQIDMSARMKRREYVLLVHHYDIANNPGWQYTQEEMDEWTRKHQDRELTKNEKAIAQGKAWEEELERELKEGKWDYE